MLKDATAPDGILHHMRNAITCCVAILVANTNAAEIDWPEFRGPSTFGIATSKSLPTSWSATENIAWRTELPGEGWSSPIVVRGKTYLTAAVPVETDNTDESEKKPYTLQLLICDVGTGKLLKSIDLFQQPSSSAKIHKKNSHASPTPTFDGENIFVHFGHQGTACVTLSGNIVWKNDALAYKPVHGNGGCPTVVDDLLIFSRDGAATSEITAMEKETGKIAWQVQRNVTANKKFSFCTPLLLEPQKNDGRRQLILPGSNVVQSLNPATGEEWWRASYDGYSVIPRPIYEAGLVFICTGYNTPSLIAIDPTGSGDVTQTHIRWQTDKTIPHTPSLVGFDGKIAMVSDKGISSCFDAQSGTPIWKERIGGNFSASPILAGNLMYLLSEEGTCTILDISTEKPTEIAVNKLGERTLASPAVVGDDLLIRTASALYRISGQN